jgi:hypothetical protein
MHSNNLVGLLGIEPRPQAPKACILPLYYSPNFDLKLTIPAPHLLRSAGNRTRVSRTRIVYTTAVLHSVTELSLRVRLPGSVTGHFFDKNACDPASRRRAPAFDSRQQELAFLVRLPGIEPESRPWQGRVLPLNHSRK